MADKKKKKKARLINPPNNLKQKVGTGGLNVKILEKAEHFIFENKFDFEPYARDFLDRLEDEIKVIRKEKLHGKEAVERLIKPIMGLKANGGMFGYPLITEIADIVLNFLENIEDMNEDAYEILNAHEKSLKIIVQNKLTGTGGAYGRELGDELLKACHRYYKKYTIRPQGIATF